MNQLTKRKDLIKTELVSVNNQIKSLLEGDEDKAKQFLAASLYVANSPELSRCTPQSIVNAVVGVAMSGLSIDQSLGQCYLIPYKNDVQLQIGYKGFIKRLSDLNYSTRAYPVFECDHFEQEFSGFDFDIDYIPNLSERNEGDQDWCYDNLIGVYVLIRNNLDHNKIISNFISKSLIEKIRLCSQNQYKPGQNTSPADKQRISKALPVHIWRKWYVEMACGKAIKMLCKKHSFPEHFHKTIVIDDKIEAGNNVDFSRTIETGNIVVSEQNKSDRPSKKDDSDANHIIVLMEECENLEDLEECYKSGYSSVSSIRAKNRIERSYKQLLSKFNISNDEIELSIKEKIKSSKSLDELNELLGSMTDDEQMDNMDLIAEKQDYFRDDSDDK